MFKYPKPLVLMYKNGGFYNAYVVASVQGLLTNLITTTHRSALSHMHGYHI